MLDLTNLSEGFYYVKVKLDNGEFDWDISYLTIYEGGYKSFAYGPKYEISPEHYIEAIKFFPNIDALNML